MKIIDPEGRIVRAKPSSTYRVAVKRHEHHLNIIIVCNSVGSLARSCNYFTQ